MRRILKFGLLAFVLLSFGACDKCGGAKHDEAVEAPMGGEAPAAPAEAPHGDAAAPTDAAAPAAAPTDAAAAPAAAAPAGEAPHADGHNH